MKGVIDLIVSGHFSAGDPELFKPLVDSLIYHDEYLLFADYQSYVDCQDRVSLTYRDQDVWTRMSILNAARMGKFSSDRTIRQYCEEIWKVRPVPVSLERPDVRGNIKAILSDHCTALIYGQGGSRRQATCSVRGSANASAEDLSARPNRIKMSIPVEKKRCDLCAQLMNTNESRETRGPSAQPGSNPNEGSTLPCIRAMPGVSLCSFTPSTILPTRSISMFLTPSSTRPA